MNASLLANERGTVSPNLVDGMTCVLLIILDKYRTCSNSTNYIFCNVMVVIQIIRPRNDIISLHTSCLSQSPMI